VAWTPLPVRFIEIAATKR